MEKQIQPNRCTCLPTCLAMCIDKPVKEILDLLGHDGSELDADGDPRYFNLFDISLVAFDLGYAIMQHNFIEVFVRRSGEVKINNRLAFDLLDNTSGHRSILLYAKKGEWVGHVIAGDGNDRWFDPLTGCQVGLPDSRRFDLIWLATVHQIKSRSDK